MISHDFYLSLSDLTSLSVIVSRSIHIAPNGNISFLVTAYHCVYTVCIYMHISCIHSSVKGNLGCFHVLAIVNSAAVNIGVRALFSCPSFFCFLGLHSCLMEVPRLGVKSELQLPAYTTATATQDLSSICDLHHSSWQCQILNPLSEARDRTYVLMDTSQIRFC